MEILKHRANTIKRIEKGYGSEIDIRDHNGEIVLSHDYPDNKVITLKEYLDDFPINSLLAINVKSSGIEKDLKRLLDKSQHRNYFVFDFSIPYLLEAIKLDLICACRLSEYEKYIFPECKWVWIDCFHSLWYDESYLKLLKKKHKIAIVSPELHGRTEQNEILKIKEMISANLIDALCTKEPKMWQ